MVVAFHQRACISVLAPRVLGAAAVAMKERQRTSRALALALFALPSHAHRVSLDAHPGLASRARAIALTPVGAYSRGYDDMRSAPEDDDEYAARRAGARGGPASQMGGRVGGASPGGAERSYARREPPRAGGGRFGAGGGGSWSGGARGGGGSSSSRAPFGERGRPARDGGRFGGERNGASDGARSFEGGRPARFGGGGSGGGNGGGGARFGGGGSGGARYGGAPASGARLGGSGGGGAARFGGGDRRAQFGVSRRPSPPSTASAAEVFGRAPAGSARAGARGPPLTSAGQRLPAGAWAEADDEAEDEAEAGWEAEEGWEDEEEDSSFAYGRSGSAGGSGLGADLVDFDDAAFDALEGGSAQAQRLPPQRIPDAAPAGQAARPQPPPSDFVYGISPVLAALSANRRKPATLYVQDSLAPKAKKDATELARALAAAARLGVRIVRLDKGELNNMARNRPHQGLLLTASALPELALDALPPVPRGAHAPPPVWLALDEIQDPQNLGALLRSAHFLGASGVLVSSRNSAPLSAATSKASAGAMEAMDVHSTTNLVRTLKRSRENGWRVVGAAMGAPGTTVASHELRLGSEPTVLVLGNEGKGLRTLVRRECDLLVAIPGQLRRAPAPAADEGGGGRGRVSPDVAAGADDGDEGGVGGDDDEEMEDGFADIEEPEWEPDDEILNDPDRQVRPTAAARGAGAQARDGGGSGRDAVDSLNVSVAGAILLHQLLVSSAAASAQE